MTILVWCVVLGLGALLCPSIGPCCVRALLSLSRALQTRSTHLRSPPESRTPKAYDTAYRDSKDVRIRSLESRNRALEEALTEERDQARQERAESDRLVGMLWSRLYEAKRRAWHAKLQSDGRMLLRTGVGIGACMLASGLILGGVFSIPAQPTEPPTTARLYARPTMVSPWVVTSGGEDPVPIPPYVIVFVAPPYDEDLGRCFDGLLVLEPTYALVDLSEENEWIRIVWIPSAFEPDPSIPYLQM